MKDYSFIHNAHPTFVENLYQQYLQNPEEVEDGWRLFFSGFEFAVSNANSSSP